MKKDVLPWIAAAGAIAFFLISIFASERVEAAERFAVWREVKIVKNDTLLSDDAFLACTEIGEEYGISPELIMAIAETESGGGSGSSKRRLRGIDAGVRPVA